MVNLYIDPGESRTGWALFSDDELVDVGLIETECDNTQYKADDHAERCMRISEALALIVYGYSVDRIVAEFPSCGAKSARAVAAMARAGAVVAGIMALTGCAYARFSPRDVKLLSTGLPNATKEQVEAVVLAKWPAAAAKLPRAKCKREHICDALAIRMADEKRGFKSCGSALLSENGDMGNSPSLLRSA